ncbi:MAG: hypothetical protein JJ953_09005 [Gracilimonas sp.]|nr:hypothetical protein [Gracilimonas sp.]MBO6586228.1 hypothetical protein [Gracilimonas sp.]MBO6614885.1 hypothetical protein [Gracilimonas sp.]
MKFLLPFLVVLLNSGINQILAGTTNSSSSVEIKQTESIEFGNTWASGQALLFSSAASGESGGSFRERLSDSNTEEDHELLAFSSRQHTFSCSPDSTYLKFSALIDESQTNKILLFPFHSFL